MKHFLKHIVLFSVFANLPFALFFGLTAHHNTNIVFKKQGGHLYSRINEIPKFPKVDVLFIGSSHAYRGFDIRFFTKNGISSFNLGSSSQSPIQSLYVLEKYLDSIDCEKIVFEVSPQAFSSDGIESTLDIISNDNMNWRTVKMGLEAQHMKVFNTLLYSAYRQLLSLDANFSEEKTIGKDTYISGGFVERQQQEFRKSASTPYEIRQPQLAAFEKIVEVIKERGIELVLVQAPVTLAEYKMYESNEKFDALMSTYSVYYNFNELITLSDSVHFYDSHHLNQSGVDVFNNALLDLLY